MSSGPVNTVRQRYWRPSRRSAVWLLICVLAALSFGRSGWKTLVPPDRPNVLLITLDTTRADRLGCYGYAAGLTPALDALSAEGVTFERAYSPAPLTLPSHASMMTGLYPPEHGLITNGRERLDDDIVTLAEILRDVGYDTAAFVSSFVLHAKFGLQQGFAVYDDDLTNTGPAESGLHRQRDGRLVVDSALSWLHQERTEPFFCWVHLYDPHDPYLTHPAEFGDRFQERPYDGEIAYVDRQLQRLRSHLQDQRLREGTLIVVVGDHGESLGEHAEQEHSLTLYNCAIQVPWIWCGHGAPAAGRRVPQPVSLVDLRPTLLEAVGVRDPHHTSGRSLRAALTGGEITAGNCYSATDDPLLEQGWSPLRSLTTTDWKYIRSPEAELYDLANDSRETRNLAAARPEQVRDLEDKLAALEQMMVLRRGEDVELSSQERRALASLGYVGGDRPKPAAESGKALPDVKRMLPLYNAVNQALQEMEDGDRLRAEQELRRIIAEAPDYLYPQRVLAELLGAQAKFTECRQVLDGILAVDPQYSAAHAQIGVIEVAQNRLETGIQHFLLALELEPDQPIVLYDVGLSLMQLGQPQQAQQYYEKALESDPTLVRAHIGMGVVLAAQRRTTEAVEHYRAALSFDPNAAEAHANLAILLAGQQRLSEAGGHFARAAKLAPENPETHFNYGTFLMTTGRQDEAIAEFSETLRLRSDHAAARQRLQQIQNAQRK